MNKQCAVDFSSVIQGKEIQLFRLGKSLCSIQLRENSSHPSYQSSNFFYSDRVSDLRKVESICDVATKGILSNNLQLNFL